MVEIIWTEPALDDLDALLEYIALDKPEAASNLARRAFARVGLLANQLEMGPVIPELRPNARYRQLVEAPCRIFYRYDKAAAKLFVLGVMRGERLFQKRLLLRRDKAGLCETAGES